jgi:hypothetical protein
MKPIHKLILAAALVVLLTLGAVTAADAFASRSSRAALLVHARSVASVALTSIAE